MFVALITLAATNVLLAGALAYVIRTHAKRDELKDAAERLERVGLLNRIQAPEAAPFMDIEHMGGEEKQYVGFDDDEAMVEAQG